jgi:hypothetical protein
VTPYFKYAASVLVAVVLALGFYRGAHACTADDEDPAGNGWTIQCSNTET